jgi:Rrf2 family protein
MLKISRKTDYALYVLGLLSKEQGPVSLRELAKFGNLPYRFLSQIMGVLKFHGFVRSKEGITGGYELAKQPRDIQISAVIEAFEGPINVVSCFLEENCSSATHCPSQSLWSVIQSHLAKVLDSYTLEDLIQQHSGGGRGARSTIHAHVASHSRT